MRIFLAIILFVGLNGVAHAEIPPTYSCTSGYSLSGTTCSKNESEAASSTTTYSCPSGYTRSGSTCSKSTTSAASKTMVCPTGTIWGVTGTGLCYPLFSNLGVAPVWNGSYHCLYGSGATLSGTTCTTTTTQTASSTTTYSCSNGWTKSGTTCSRTLTTSASASCPSDYHLSGSFCLPNNIDPVVSDSIVSLDEDTSKVISASFSDGDPDNTHSITDLIQPANGTVIVFGTNFTFTPEPDWFGTTSFSYKVQDNHGAISEVATVTVTVNPVNDAPSVTAVTFNLEEDELKVLTPVITDVDG